MPAVGPTAGARTGCSGICDRQARLCFALALWNEQDFILKERLFGLTGPEGNHGEDVKELYYYLDAAPTYSYMKAQYKYPQLRVSVPKPRGGKREARTPWSESSSCPTSACSTAGATSTSCAEYAKGGPNDIVARFTISNRGPEARPHSRAADACGFAIPGLGVGRAKAIGQSPSCTPTARSDPMPSTRAWASCGWSWSSSTG